jgi:hypothetical protein
MHTHTAFENHPLGIAARTQAGMGNNLCEAI